MEQPRKIKLRIWDRIKSTINWLTTSNIINTVLAFAAVGTLWLTKDALTDNGNQFTIQNSPYLALLSMPTSVDTATGKVTTSFTILDLGVQPVHTYRLKYKFISHGISQHEGLDELKNIHYDTLNAFISPAYPLNQYNIPVQPLDSTGLENLRKGNCSVIGELDYVNPLTCKWRTFIFIVRISSGYKNNFTAVLYNENADTKKAFEIP